MWVEFVLAPRCLCRAATGRSAATPQGQALSAWASLAIGVLFAFEANDLRAASLAAARLPACRRGERPRPHRGRALVLHQVWLPQQQRKPRQRPKRGIGATAATRRRRRRPRVERARRSSGSSRGLDATCTSPSSITVRGTSTPPPRRSSARRGRAARRLPSRSRPSRRGARGRADRAARRRRVRRLPQRAGQHPRHDRGARRDRCGSAASLFSAFASGCN